jgi:RNA polymerase sigma-70 factor (ECF subfamily)
VRRQVPRSPSPADAPDAHAAGLLAGRNLEASELFAAHAAFVCSFIERLGVPAPTSGDLVQDVFLIVHRKGGYRVGPAKPTTWLAGLALGVVRNHRRREQTRDRGNILMAHEAAARRTRHDPLSDQADARRALTRVKVALDALEENQRVVFMLYELEGESTSAIAAGLQIPTGTVYSRLHAARKAFRLAYEAQGSAPYLQSEAS